MRYDHSDAGEMIGEAYVVTTKNMGERGKEESEERYWTSRTMYDRRRTGENFPFFCSHDGQEEKSGGRPGRGGME